MDTDSYAAALKSVVRQDPDVIFVGEIRDAESALSAIQALIREGQVRKRYLALLAGRLPQPRVRVDAALRKQVLQGGERMVRVDQEGKASLSEFRLLRACGAFSYVEVVIETGRTHQIRVHAAHIGAPVAGDPKYGDEEANRILRERGLRRLFLHAAEFSFRLPDGTDYTIAAPLPPELVAVLDRL